MKHLYLLRHGRQNDKHCNLNVPLSKEGHEQADFAGRRLVDFHIEKLYSSDLIRARETAEDINRHLNLPYEVLEGIHEIDFGDLTGHSDDEIAKDFKEFLTKQKAMEEEVSYPNGENGSDVVKRALPVLHTLMEQKEDRIAIVTHGGVIRAVVAYLLQMDMSKMRLLAKDLENLSITELVYDEDNKRFYLERLNDYAHLEGKDHLLRMSWKG